MVSRAVSIPLRRGFHQSRLAQIGLITIFWLTGESLVRLVGLPLPGGIVGMLVAFMLLASRHVSLFSLRRGADWFLGEMLLFFIPAVLAIIDHRELFSLLGLKILAVIVASTAVVMMTTALTVDLCYRWRMKHVYVKPSLE